MILIKNPCVAISRVIAISIIYSAAVVYESGNFLLDGRGSTLNLNLIEIIQLALIVIIALLMHANLFNLIVRKYKIKERAPGNFTLFTGILIAINFILWILLDYGGVNSVSIPGAYFISLFNLQIILPIYSCVAKKNKLNIAIILIGIMLTLFRGSTAALFFTLIIISFRMSYMQVIQIKKIAIYVLVAIVISVVANEIKVMTRGALTDLNFIDYGIARINQISNLLLFAQNVNFFKNNETSFIPQIVYEIFSYIIPNSILGFDPFLSYEFLYTEVLSDYSGIVSFSTLTWFGKFYLYLHLGLYGSALIFVALPIICGFVLRAMVVNLSEREFIPAIYVAELVFILSGDTSSYFRFFLLLFIILFFRNYKHIFSFLKNRKIPANE